jgi:hypothetical protein
MWKRQDGRYGACGQLLREDEVWHLHHRIKRSQGGSDDASNWELFTSPLPPPNSSPRVGYGVRPRLARGVC